MSCWTQDPTPVSFHLPHLLNLMSFAGIFGLVSKNKSKNPSAPFFLNTRPIACFLFPSWFHSKIWAVPPDLSHLFWFILSICSCILSICSFILSICSFILSICSPGKLNWIAQVSVYALIARTHTSTRHTWTHIYTHLHMHTLTHHTETHTHIYTRGSKHGTRRLTRTYTHTHTWTDTLTANTVTSVWSGNVKLCLLQYFMVHSGGWIYEYIYVNMYKCIRVDAYV